MKYSVLLCLSYLMISCSFNPTSDYYDLTTVTITNHYVDDFIIGNNFGISFEVVDYYGIVDSIASDKYERSFLVQKLKEVGYELISWGRGNSMFGPRIINYTMSNGKNECDVIKNYLSTEEEGKYFVTEKLVWK